MPPDSPAAIAVPLRCPWRPPLLLVLAALAGCASHVPAPAPAPTPAVRVSQEAPPPAPAAQPAAAQPPTPAPQMSAADASQPPVQAALAHADRIRGLPAAELAQEITRLNDGASATSPLRQVQLALTLLQTQVAGDGQRAQGLLQRVLAQDTPEARPLHPLARLVVAQYGAQRRAEEQAERQAQQLRDGQRRIDQLNERLEALRAIERSMPSRPAP